MTATVLDAVNYLMPDSGASRPDTNEVVEALLAAEKQCRRERLRYDYAQLTGTWRLGFVSGTQTVAIAGRKPVKRPGKGRFVPRWVAVSIRYGPQAELLPEVLLGDMSVSEADDAAQRGAVVNRVALGKASLQLSGPTGYWPKTNTLGFDFVYLQGGVGPVTFYSGPVRGGVSRAQTFAQQPLREQAFFTFFAVQPDYIAARGKGGGLALWIRETAAQA